MQNNETIRKTFAEDSNLTPRIIGVFAGIARVSQISFKEKKQASEPLYKELSQAKKLRKKSEKGSFEGW